MSAKVLIPLVDGFEDVEAVTVVDVLRRGGVEVVTAAVGGAGEVKSAHGIAVKADALFADAADAAFGAVVLPGGPGTPALKAEPVVARVRPDHHRLPADFPFTVFARTLRGVIARYGERLLIKSPNMGALELRAAIVAYLSRTRGLRVKASQIAIGSGAEYLYGLLAQMFRGETVAIEDPSYAKIGEVYAAHGVRTKMLRLGAHGIPDAALRRLKAALLHVTPYRSYPTGVTADASKRRAYVNWARTRGGFLIEDDFGSEFAPGRCGAETLFALDGGRRVIYLNTFSKTVAPSLRIGYMVLPPALARRYARTVGFYPCTVPVFDQLFLADFINSGAFERHLNRLRRAQRASRG